MADQSGLLLAGRYRLAQRLGEGSSATVYRGNDTLLDRPVAVKLFHQHGAGPTVVVRQQAEMLFLAQLNHPNLVSIYDAQMPSPRVDRCPGGNEPTFLVMEFIAGRNLAQRLARRAMTLEESAEVGRAVASALAAVHCQGLIHRDVKPANILLSENGVAKLTDFGIARLVNSAHLTSTAEVLGTPLYLSPEQARGSDVGSASDIYSLGLVLLECLTGNAEFPGTPVQSAIARLLRDPQMPFGLPPPLLTLLRSMTSPVPAERPTADTVAAVLTAHLDDRERSRAADTVSTPAAADEMDVRHPAPRPVAVGRAPTVAPRSTTRQRLREVAVLIGGLALAVTGVCIAVPGTQFGHHPTDPASTPTVVSSSTHATPIAARRAAATTAPASDIAGSDGNFAGNVNIIAITTETVTMVSTLIQTPITLPETTIPPSAVSGTATTVTETDTATTTPDASTQVSSSVTPSPVVTLPSGIGSTDESTIHTSPNGIGTSVPPGATISGLVAHVRPSAA